MFTFQAWEEENKKHSRCNNNDHAMFQISNAVEG
jgi:hypothetical protein